MRLGWVEFTPCRANDYLILIIRELNIFKGCGLYVRAPTWDPSGDQTRCPTFLIFSFIDDRGVAQLVARTAGGREVAGSSPVTPTMTDSLKFF